jgi:hypothetical protein
LRDHGIAQNATNPGKSGAYGFPEFAVHLLSGEGGLGLVFAASIGTGLKRSNV